MMAWFKKKLKKSIELVGNNKNAEKLQTSKQLT